MIISIMVLVPNLLWLIFPSSNTLSTGEGKKSFYLTIMERTGQFGVIIIPIFYPIVLNDAMSGAYLIIMSLLLLIYYGRWLRFFRGGRNHLLLFLPLWRIPIPMAIGPVLYFFFSAGLLKSFPMLLAASVFAIGHLPVSYREYLRIFGL